MAESVLWIRLEDKNRAQKHPIIDGDLYDLAEELCRKQFLNIDIEPEYLEFFSDYDKTQYPGGNDDDGDNKSLRSDIQLQHLRGNSAKSPLIVRYPLSKSTIVVDLKFIRTSHEIIMPHSTGCWAQLQAFAKKKFPELQENDLFFADQETQETEIEIKNEFTFKYIIKKIKPNIVNERSIKLLIRMKGKKAYGDYDIVEALKALHQECSNYIPRFDIETEPQEVFSDGYNISEEERKSFKDRIMENWTAFSGFIDSKAVARFFINTFMTLAVSHANKVHPTMILRIEQETDGSLAYGVLDYLVRCYGIMILVVTVAELGEIKKGIAQNIMQLHTALEESRKLKCDDLNSIPVYGIVTTGRMWRFIRLSGSPKNPDLAITSDYDCAFTGGCSGTEKILQLITQILLSQATKLDPNTEERKAQRRRVEA